MERTPAYDPSMTPSAATAPRTTTAVAATTTATPNSQTMVYVCGDCHRENELKSTDVIRCKIHCDSFQ